MTISIRKWSGTHTHTHTHTHKHAHTQTHTHTHTHTHKHTYIHTPWLAHKIVLLFLVQFPPLFQLECTKIISKNLLLPQYYRNISSAWRDQMSSSDSMATVTENASMLGYKHVCVNYLHVSIKTFTWNSKTAFILNCGRSRKFDLPFHSQLGDWNGVFFTTMLKMNVPK